MNRFFACLRYRCEVADDNAELFEESIRLIDANSLEAAEEKAALLGKSTTVSYANQLGEQVSWEFCEVVDVQEFSENELVDGAEVYSRLYRPSAYPGL